MTPSDDFGQLRLKFTDPVQDSYEVIRPIVLFSETISERSRQTGVERTQVGEKAKRFVQQGMLGLVDQRTDKAGRKPHQYPEPIAAHILYLKQLYPPFIIVKSSASLSGNSGIKPIIIRLKVFRNATQFRFNLGLICRCSTSLRMPIRLAGPWCRCITRARISGVLPAASIYRVVMSVGSLRLLNKTDLPVWKMNAPDHPTTRTTN